LGSSKVGGYPVDAIGWLATDSVTPETTYKFYCADLIQYLSVVMLCKHFCLAGKVGRGVDERAMQCKGNNLNSHK